MTAVLDRPDAASPVEPATHDAPSRRRVRWAPFALAGLLVSTAVLYLWNLSASGYANTFYAAAAQAGAQSWKAWFFGALDSANFITVDKPPASLWATGLSVRIFGMNSWAVLVPQALMGVAAVALLYAAMRRTFADRVHGTVAGLIAGGVLAFTPAAALMFRFNNPDALLVLLMVAAGYALIRAVATNSTRWLMLVGVALGFAFLTKMLQGLLVLPAFGLTYLLFATNGWLKRIGQLVAATAALVVSAGWFVVVTMIVPASSRPYIGGSTDNSFMDLVLGYNGVGRINGGGGGRGPMGGGGAGGAFGGETGLARLFSYEMGNEISWLLPVALFVLVFAIYLGVRDFVWLRFENPITRLEGAAVTAWGGWLIVTGLIFCYMSGTIHPYYTVALAPAIGALVGLGAVFAWRRRDHWDGRIALAAMIGLAGWWAVVLFARNDFGPAWCRWLIGGASAVAVIGVLIAGAVGARKVMAAAVIAGTIAAGAGTVSFAIATAATPHGGSIPNAVNTDIQDTGRMGGMGGPGAMPGGMGGMGMPGGMGMDGSGDGGMQTPAPQQDSGPQGTEQQGRAQQGRPGPGGGPDGGSSNNDELTDLLTQTTTTWAAATSGSQSAAGMEIASGKAVMAIGGWSGDPAPTLDQFKAYVRDGKIAYYVGGGGRGGPGGNSEIATWVAENFTATTVGGTTVYKLI